MANQGFYRILHWSRLYESSRSRRNKNPPRYVEVPSTYLDIQHRLVAGAGMDCVGVMFCMIKLAANLPRRGCFIDNQGQSMSFETIAEVIGADPETVKAAIRVFIKPTVGFLEFAADAEPEADKPRKRAPAISAEDRAVFLAQAEEIYDAYPRKSAKQAGIKAIISALKRGVVFSELLETTVRYAHIRKDQPVQFTPYPGTWYNGRRYKESEESWRTDGPAARGVRKNGAEGGGDETGLNTDQYSDV